MYVCIHMIVEMHVYTISVIGSIFFIDNISMHVAQNCIGYDFLDG